MNKKLARKDLYNTLEVLYQVMLNNYKKQPRDENWQNIEAKLEEDRAHQEIRNKFDHFVPAPAMKNWDAVQNKMVASSSNDKRLNFMALAASLALLLFAYSKTVSSSQLELADFTSTIISIEDMSFDLCPQSQLVALDIVKPVLKAEKRKKKKARKNESKQKRLLDIILAEDEGIASQVDSLLIAELLRPVGILPEESMFANLGESYYFYKQGNEYKKMYTLPEIDYLLEMPSDTQSAILFELLETKKVKHP